MTDFTWNISFQLTGTYLNNTTLVETSNVPVTVTGTLVTDSDSGFLQEGDFTSFSFTWSAPSVGFIGSAAGAAPGTAGNILYASGDTLSYVLDPINVAFAPHAFFVEGFSDVDFGADLNFSNFVQGDIRLANANNDRLDATVMQPFQIGTEVVATLTDVSIIGTSETTVDLSTIFNVGGDVTISDNDQLVSIDLSNLQSVGGNFTLTNNGALLTLTLPDISVGGTFNLGSNATGGDLSLGGASTTTGTIDVSDNATGGSLSLGDASTTTGTINVDANSTGGDLSLGSVTTDTGSINVNNNAIGGGLLDLNGLTTTAGSVDVTGNTVITIDLSALLQAGAIVISDNGIITLDMSALVQAGGDVSITDNTHLLSVDLPDLTSVDGNLNITGDSSLTSVDISSLATVHGDLTINSAADATLDASALGPAGGTVKLIGDNLTTTIALGNLAHMDGTLTVSSADGVTLTANAGFADLTLTGTDADNTLIGSATVSNTIDGKLGNDLMTGSSGDDAFVFDFSVSQEAVPHHDFISLANVTEVTIGDQTYERPADKASITAWNNWNAELTSWANGQANNTGGDDFTSFTNANPGGKHSANTVGTIQLIDGYFHDYNTTVTDLAGDGFDTITNFAHQAFAVTNGGGGNDTLLFNGLSADQTAPNYWGNWLSSTALNGNTTIEFHDVANHGADISSITLLGVTTDVATLVQHGAIQFDTGFHLT